MMVPLTLGSTAHGASAHGATDVQYVVLSAPRPGETFVHWLPFMEGSTSREDGLLFLHKRLTVRVFGAPVYHDTPADGRLLCIALHTAHFWETIDDTFVAVLAYQAIVSPALVHWSRLDDSVFGDTVSVFKTATRVAAVGAGAIRSPVLVPINNHGRTRVLFATLLLGLQRLEELQVVPLAHHSMLEDMLECWTLLDHFLC